MALRGSCTAGLSSSSLSHLSARTVGARVAVQSAPDLPCWKTSPAVASGLPGIFVRIPQ